MDLGDSLHRSPARDTEPEEEHEQPPPESIEETPGRLRTTPATKTPGRKKIPQPPPPYVELQSAKKVRNDVNVHKDTVRLEPDDLNPGLHLVSFVFDALFDGRILFVEKYVSVLEWTVCNSKGMDTTTVNQAGQGDARSTMEVAGMKREMDMRSLLVWTRTVLSASAHQDSKEMVLRRVKMLMSAKRRKPVSARNVAARTPGEATNALVVGTFST